MKPKACTRTPKKNIFWRDIPASATVVDCGRLFVAQTAKGSAVVYWGSQDAKAAQAALKRRAR